MYVDNINPDRVAKKTNQALRLFSVFLIKSDLKSRLVKEKPRMRV